MWGLALQIQRPLLDHLSEDAMKLSEAKDTPHKKGFVMLFAPSGPCDFLGEKVFSSKGAFFQGKEASLRKKKKSPSTPSRPLAPLLGRPPLLGDSQDELYR